MPATRTRETKKQSEDKSASGKRRGSRTRVDASAQPDLTPGTTLFMQRYLGNTYLQSIIGHLSFHSTGHSIECK